MSSIGIVIATYGAESWATLANERAWPSATGTADNAMMCHHPFGTRATSLNQGADVIGTDWLLFLDADDEFAPGYVGAMRRALEQHGGDGTRNVLFTPAVQHIRRGRPGPPSFFRLPKRATLRDHNWLVIGTMIHRDLFTEVGGFPGYPHGFEDFALWSKCHRIGAKVVKVPDAVYRYHHNPQSAHRAGWRDKRWQSETHLRVIAELDEWERHVSA